jgi:hypothetical protein
MTSTWNDLASSSRWDGVVRFIRNWAGPFDCDQGMAPVELDIILRAKSLDLPVAVREWYLLAANWNHVSGRPERASDGRFKLRHFLRSS